MKRGITRIVVLVGRFAIKIPNFTYSHLHFLKGCRANWSEREFYRTHSKANYEGNMSSFVAPSLFCSWFGLLQIQKRCEPMTRDLTDVEKQFFKPLCGLDNKRENFGTLEGKVVCLDYE